MLAAGAVFYGMGLDQDGPLRDWWNGWADQGFWALLDKERSTINETFPYLTNMLTPWGQFGENEIIMGQRPEVLGYGLRLGLSAVGCIAGAACGTSSRTVAATGSWMQC